ncbi:MAG: uncharacterized membrane protein YsdA (DUF1294 family) [Motiliproteus sp.]|jgi:uncharacterized membrane protein YsdA (DUF1294 family)
MKPQLPVYIFIVFLLGSFVAGYLPAIIILVYLFMGTITFFIYWKDKAAAVSGKWRVNERTLHLCGLLFGWVGALIAQQYFRHKTHKKSFRLMFWMTVVVNISFIGWLHTDAGGEVLQTGMYKVERFVANIDSVDNVMPWLLELTRFQQGF